MASRAWGVGEYSGGVEGLVVGGGGGVGQLFENNQ